jgi:hypothetical protein
MPKNIFLYCKPASFNWFVLSELQSRLLKIGLDVKSQRIEISRYPTAIEYDSIADALLDVQVNGEPKRYHLSFYGESNHSLHLIRLVNMSDEEILSINMTGIGSLEDVRSLADFLGLTIDAIPEARTKLERTCFIAHRFDNEGSEMADKLARFLSLLDFNVSTGRGFAPGSVSVKVKSRMNQQAIVFAVLTLGEDNTWLTQESTLASLEKPLFLLKEKQYPFKPGLLGDHEFIPFTAPTIETTFIPILEGLRNLGFKN